MLYRGKFHPGLGTDHRLSNPVDFLALLIPHVLLKFEVVIRSDGAVSTTIRRLLGWIQKGRAEKQPPAAGVIAEEESGFVKLRRRNWARLIRKVWLDDLELCPRCGQKMRVIAAISSPAQVDVIEMFLKAIGRWDPPWLRRRPARGPPLPAGFPGEERPPGKTRIKLEEGYNPGEEDWEEGVDPEPTS